MAKFYIPQEVNDQDRTILEASDIGAINARLGQIRDSLFNQTIDLTDEGTVSFIMATHNFTLANPSSGVSSVAMNPLFVALQTSAEGNNLLGKYAQESQAFDNAQGVEALIEEVKTADLSDNDTVIDLYRKAIDPSNEAVKPLIQERFAEAGIAIHDERYFTGANSGFDSNINVLRIDNYDFDIRPTSNPDGFVWMDDYAIHDLHRAKLDPFNAGVADQIEDLFKKEGVEITDNRTNQGPNEGRDGRIELQRVEPVEPAPEVTQAPTEPRFPDGAYPPGGLDGTGEELPPTEQAAEATLSPEEQLMEQPVVPAETQTAEEPATGGPATDDNGPTVSTAGPTTGEFNDANCADDVHSTYTVEKGNVLSDFAPRMLHDQNNDAYMQMFEGMDKQERIKFSSAIVAKFNGLESIHEIGIGTVIQIPTLEEAQNILKQNDAELQGRLREYGIHENPGAEFSKAGPADNVNCAPTGVDSMRISS